MIMETNNVRPDNPNAFPVIDPHGSYGQLGMDLRDYFAAKALYKNNMGVGHESETAKRCYALADAMLNERQKLIIEVNNARIEEFNKTAVF